MTTEPAATGNDAIEPLGYVRRPIDPKKGIDLSELTAQMKAVATRLLEIIADDYVDGCQPAAERLLKHFAALFPSQGEEESVLRARIDVYWLRAFIWRALISKDGRGELSRKQYKY